ncbi:hypothetical protein [Streptomyces arboris]|uniref:hypothetical protein n=1 Tax=Streptomyces arboris TaxID=2600619 RepID=UPI003BF55481
MGAVTRKRGLYVGFKRAIDDDARGRLGPNAEYRTAHSLASCAVGRHYAWSPQQSPACSASPATTTPTPARPRSLTLHAW